MGRNQFCEERVSPSGRFEGRLPELCEFVVLPWGSLFRICNRLLLPVRANQLVALKPPHGRVDRSTGQAGHLHDAESIDVTGVDCLENHRGGMREPGFACHGGNCIYVADYLTSEQ